MYDFENVYEELFDAREKWREIGRKLGLQRSDLNNIEEEYVHNARRLEEVLTVWLKRPSLTPSWQSLIHALRAKIVDEGGIAGIIEDKYVISRKAIDKDTVARDQPPTKGK